MALTILGRTQLSKAGTTTNDNAAAGDVGEIVTGTRLRSSASNLTTNVALNVASIILTAGDWDVRAMCGFQMAATTSISQYISAISTVSATLPTSDTTAVPDSTGQVIVRQAFSAQVPNNDFVLSTPLVRISLTSTTTYYLVALSTFTVASNAAYGSITARRVR